MEDFKEKFLDVLEQIKGNGSFVSNHIESFVFPGLNILGVGEISFPVNTTQIKEMIAVAHKAPFGKGSETVLDATVRSAWEIDAHKISFSNKAWWKVISGIVAKIKPDLGIEEHEVSANLYKLLIYEKGDFFVAHKDSEKEKGMFGSLIIALPCTHTGGELVIRFDGEEKIVDFSEATSEYKIAFAAFYADCDHEIKPITSGYRVCLVYNLIQTKGSEKIELNPIGGYTQKLATLLRKYETEKPLLKIVLLGHQYTPENFTMYKLKLNDRPKAAAILQAAAIAGYYCKLGLVTSYQMGELEMDNSRGRSRRGYYYDEYDDDDLAENGTMGEVYDEGIRVEHWMAEGVPPLRNIEIKEDELITDLTLNDGEPDEKDATGYTGNAGMDIEYWYHYGAIFLWHKNNHLDMLAGIDTTNKLEWIEYYNQIWDSLPPIDKTITKELVEAVLQENIVKTDISALLKWLMNIKDTQYLLKNASAFLTTNFTLITKEGWLELFKTYPYSNFENVFANACEAGKPENIKHTLDILNILLLNNADTYQAFIQHQIDQMPNYIHNLRTTYDGQTIIKDIFRKILYFESLKINETIWSNKIVEAFTFKLTREYVNDVLLTEIMQFGKKTPIIQQILAVSMADLERRVTNQPQPPADWQRPLPNGATDKKVWNIITEFLLSPKEQVFDYKALQGYRLSMEEAINKVTIDIKMETIKKGSPHTLRLIKTQDAYQRELAKWKIDVGLLETVSNW